MRSLYFEARAPEHVGELFMACDKLIRSFVENEKGTQARFHVGSSQGDVHSADMRCFVSTFTGDLKDAKNLFQRLKNEAFEHQKTLRDNIRLYLLSCFHVTVCFFGDTLV